MNFLNAQQLAFILDIKKEDARAMMCNAWEKSKGIEKVGTELELGAVLAGVKRDKVSKKIEDKYPLAMEIDMLSKELNLPELGFMVTDIETNYLKRPATRKWILSDYPENKIRLAKEKGHRWKSALPTALKSMLPTEVIETIQKEWKERFKV